MSEEDTNDSKYNLNRRTALKAAGMAGMGFSGFGGVASARGPQDNAGGGPPGRSCEGCPDELDNVDFEAKYKFECVDTDPGTGECIDWNFVFESGDDVVDITYIFDDDKYNKNGEKAEPNFIKFEADGYIIQSVCVYGGRDTDRKVSEDGLTEFASNLKNPGGQEAAISNVVFCGVAEPEVVDFPETVSVAYEDLPPGAGNDYDYNDWVVDIEATLYGTQTSEVNITSIEMDLTPVAAGGGDDHDWYIVPKAELGESIEYELTWFGSDGEVISTESDTINGRDLGDVTAAFPITNPVETLDLDEGGIFVFDSTDVFASGEIVNAMEGDSCTLPDQTAHLTLTLDEPWTVDPDELDELAPHGGGLFINPVKVSQNTGANRDQYPVAVGDNRFLAVPTDWAWPNEAVHIANAYEDVSVEDPPAEDGKPPIFEEDDWFDGTVDENLVFDACRD